MLRPRIIPCLLLRNQGLVKTVGFDKPKYVGDPLNAVRIFNEKFVDELVVFDIDATVDAREPNYRLISQLAAECRMPLCYGGGIRRLEQAVRVIRSGVEKVAMSSALVERPALAREFADYVGSQSVVAVLDVQRDWRGRYRVFTRNGTINSRLDPAVFAAELEGWGVGEITINSIDRDGTAKGYDFELVRQVRDAVSVPLTVIGGAGSLSDIQALVHKFGVIGAAAGSLFVFKGQYRAVLINYPTRRQKDDIAESSRVQGAL